MNERRRLPLFRFAPVFREYLWGGRRLGSVLNKPIGNGETYAESWEVVDHGQDQSVVSAGEFAGKTLSHLVKHHGESLLGPVWHDKIRDPDVPAHLQFRFPLLIKWLDANKNLSIQVHPNDDQGAKLNPPDLGKTEAWYIADAAPGAKVYAGLKPGIDKKQFAEALNENRIAEVLHSFEPKVGDCLFIPAGTVHALGEGLLVAEVQQASNTTYRIFDWNRVGPDGNPRQLHLQQALEVSNYETGPVQPQESTSSELQSIVGPSDAASSLVDCPYFRIDRIHADSPFQLPTNQCQILIGLSGQAELSCETSDSPSQIEPLEMGQTILVPYQTGVTTIKPVGSVSMLIARLP